MPKNTNDLSKKRSDSYFKKIRSSDPDKKITMFVTGARAKKMGDSLKKKRAHWPLTLVLALVLLVLIILGATNLTRLTQDLQAQDENPPIKKLIKNLIN